MPVKEILRFSMEVPVLINQCRTVQESAGRTATLSGEADLKGEIVFAYKKGIIVEKSYVEDGGKLVMETTSPQAMTITNTNYARASFLLIR